MIWNWMLQKCPWCDCLHDDGVLIQTDFHDETVYVCFDCADEYFDGNETKYLDWKIRRCRQRVLSHLNK